MREMSPVEWRDRIGVYQLAVGIEAVGVSWRLAFENRARLGLSRPMLSLSGTFARCAALCKTQLDTDVFGQSLLLFQHRSLRNFRVDVRLSRRR